MDLLYTIFGGLSSNITMIRSSSLQHIQKCVFSVYRIAVKLGGVVLGDQLVGPLAVDGQDVGEQDGQVGVSHRAGGCL